MLPFIDLKRLKLNTNKENVMPVNGVRLFLMEDDFEGDWDDEGDAFDDYWEEDDEEEGW